MKHGRACRAGLGAARRGKKGSPSPLTSTLAPPFSSEPQPASKTGYRGAGATEDHGVSLLVRGLSSQTGADSLREAFRAHGEVVDIYIPLDYRTK